MNLPVIPFRTSVAILLMLVPGQSPAAEEGEAAFVLSGINDQRLDPLDPGEKKAAVLFFVSPFCPTSNTFARLPSHPSHRSTRCLNSEPRPTASQVRSTS